VIFYPNPVTWLGDRCIGSENYPVIRSPVGLKMTVILKIRKRPA